MKFYSYNQFINENKQHINESKALKVLKKGFKDAPFLDVFGKKGKMSAKPIGGGEYEVTKQSGEGSPMKQIMDGGTFQELVGGYLKKSENLNSKKGKALRDQMAKKDKFTAKDFMKFYKKYKDERYTGTAMRVALRKMIEYEVGAKVGYHAGIILDIVYDVIILKPINDVFDNAASKENLAKVNAFLTAFAKNKEKTSFTSDFFDDKGGVEKNVVTTKTYYEL